MLSSMAIPRCEAFRKTATGLWPKMGQSAYGRALRLRIQQTAGGWNDGDHDVDRCLSDAMDSGYSRKGVK